MDNFKEKKQMNFPWETGLKQRIKTYMKLFHNKRRM